MAQYRRPDPFTSYIFNPTVQLLNRLGISLAGSRTLEVRGRKSGEWRSTPVNPVEIDGVRYLVAPRGNTQWVRNIRAAGVGRLRSGRRVEDIRVTEVPDADKVPILRAYLTKWAWEAGTFFGVGRNPSDDDLRRIAPNHPVFRIE